MKAATVLRAMEAADERTSVAYRAFDHSGKSADYKEWRRRGRQRSRFLARLQRVCDTYDEYRVAIAYAALGLVHRPVSQETQE